MNLPTSFSVTRSPRSILAAGAFTLLSLSDSAQAVVLVTFAQSGSNVTATLSGSLRLPTFASRFVDEGSPSPYAVLGSTDSLSATVAPDLIDVYLGTHFSSGLNQNPDSFSDLVSFGYAGLFLIVNSTIEPSSTIMPTGFWQWNNKTLADIGLDYLTTTPVIVYETGGSVRTDTIQFVAAVPEPSSAALLGLGAATLAFRRRRLARA